MQVVLLQPTTGKHFVCLFGFNVAFNIICHITMVSGCDRELNAHFYSAASLWYQIPDTLPDIAPLGTLY